MAAPAGAGPAFPTATNLLSIPTREATPALWEVRDGDTTIYLFGTFHTLDRRTRWCDRSVRTAFDRSDELVLETIVPEQPGAITALGRQAVGATPGAFLAATRSAIARSKA
ncbi:MAG: TraB/GumN family protein, partial [Sphingomonas bacterium]|nr:TraB/GumN family protein [Sphingomonas bacterium]